MLVVDDEPMLGASVQRLLRRDYDVSVVQRGADAVARIAAGERFDAVLCDVNLPDLDGVAVHAAIAELDPTQAERVLFFSGGCAAPDLEAKLRRLPNEQLDKPFELADLRRAIDRVARR